jgi:hypothetical protein
MTHAGMVPVVADAPEVEDGVYRSDGFAFDMAGDWIITVDVTHPDGRRDQGTLASASRAEASRRAAPRRHARGGRRLGAARRRRACASASAAARLRAAWHASPARRGLVGDARPPQPARAPRSRCSRRARRRLAVRGPPGGAARGRRPCRTTWPASPSRARLPGSARDAPGPALRGNLHVCLLARWTCRRRDPGGADGAAGRGHRARRRASHGGRSRPGLKWVNDLMLADRKVGGVLSPRRCQRPACRTRWSGSASTSSTDAAAAATRGRAARRQPRRARRRVGAQPRALTLALLARARRAVAELRAGGGGALVEAYRRASLGRRPARRHLARRRRHERAGAPRGPARSAALRPTWVSSSTGTRSPSTPGA